MPLEYLKKQQKKIQKNSDFYTSSGLQVFFKEPIEDDSVNIQRVVNCVESSVPPHLMDEVEMVVVGWFEEFEERSIGAFYKDGALYLSHLQDDENEMCEDVVHEVAHSLEGPYGYEIYSDQKLKDEFLRKRQHLYDILWAQGYRIPKSVFMDTEYNKDFDMFLYEKIGYDNLFELTKGLFITPYAATSLREYFATAFTDFYIRDDAQHIKAVSPALYEKISFLHDIKNLDI